jgi:hypothetical protein
MFAQGLAVHKGRIFMKRLRVITSDVSVFRYELSILKEKKP